MTRGPIISLRSPVFVVGAERSCTTMFRLMLAHHPEIAVCSEFEYVVDPLVGLDDWPALPSVHERLRSDWIFQDQGFTIDPTLGYADLATSFLQQQSERDGGSFIVAVVHRNIEQLPRIWPEARYIHLVRDPRDVSRSVVNKGWAGNLWHGANRWVDLERAWERLHKTLPSERFIEIRAETLVLSPEDVLANVCRFIGTEYDPRMLQYSNRSTYDRPDPQLVEQWKRKLCPRDIALVEARTGPLLQARGYLPSGHPRWKSTALRRLRLRLHDKFCRVQYRVREQGVRLVLAEYVSRKLGLKRWHRREMERVAEVRRSRLK